MDPNKTDMEFENFLRSQAPVVPALEARERANLLRRVRLEAPFHQPRFGWKFLGWSISATAAVFVLFISLSSSQKSNSADAEDVYALLLESDLDSNLADENSEYTSFLDSSAESLIYE